MAAAATAAPSAQRAGPVALVNPVQVALDGFSEDVNQDGFVDPIAPAAIAAPIAAPWGYGLGAPWGYGKREAEAEPEAYTIGQVHAGLPLVNAYATGHPHNVGYTTNVGYTHYPYAHYGYGYTGHYYG